MYSYPRVNPAAIDLDIHVDHKHWRMQLSYCSLFHDRQSSNCAMMADLHIMLMCGKCYPSFIASHAELTTCQFLHQIAAF